ncbi:MAG: LysM peptidoglycan-binding domain-containing protein [Clostridia bacterium]|nr:LysM peptidoglycan-binding domain-containing protein [Clostridia bacterium]
MYQLVLEKSKYYRVKKGQTALMIEKAFSVPVNGNVYEGMIIALPQQTFTVYRAAAGDTYKSVAAKFGVDEELLKSVNGNRAVYPTCRLYIPR